jgi:phosphoinositide-3-kinase regulatory subunit 4
MQKNLGGYFLESVSAALKHPHSLLQVYFKREDSPELAPYERRLREIATALAAAPAAHPHVWPFQRVLQTERAAYLLRQHLFSDLHDRTLTRPFLAGSEKKWLAFQMLCAVHEVCVGALPPSRFPSRRPHARRDGHGWRAARPHAAL